MEQPRRWWRMLFSGMAVGCIGGVLLLIGTLQQLLDPPAIPRISEIGGVMFWCGFSWALLVWYLKPFPLPGLGIVFAVLFALIVPLADEAELIVLVTAWPYMVWATVCLAIFALILVSMYREVRGRAERYAQLLKEERIQAGRNPVTGERP